MIVRESPKAKVPHSAPNWPPKSPLQAQLASPSGRKKLQERRRDVSPSPVKRSAGKSREKPQLGISSDDDSDDDEDEEALQLKLEALKAKLKLKKLKKAKEKASASSGIKGDGQSRVAKSNAPSSLPPRQSQTRQVTPDVQVPFSPVKRRSPPPPTSPARVLLGIDKGLKAQDVSLKRSPRKPASSLTYGLTSRTTSSASHHTAASATSAQRPKSFSERLAESRAQERQKEEQQARNHHARSSGFGIKAQDMEEARKIMPPLSSKKSFVDSKPIPIVTPSSHPSPFHRAASPQKATPEADDSSFDPYTSLHLSKRHLPYNILTRSLSNKEIFSIPRLLKSVHSPHYEPPDIEGDYVVLGIIASKSLPRNHKETHKTANTGNPDDQPQRSKFMVLRLTDLQWEIDLFLFDTGFEAFWKLTPGTVIAILNPGIMPPRNKDTGAFSLKLSSSEDTVLEIGTSRDLTFCSAVKKDGKECTQWVDGRKTSVCEFHLALQLEKTKAGRMEVNTVSGFNRNKDSKSSFNFMGGGAGGKEGVNSRYVRPKSPPNGKKYDKFLHETYYISQGASSTAKLIDEDNDHNAFERGMSREELDRKRRAEKEKERDLGAQLAKIGGGMGSEYLKLRQPAPSARDSRNVSRLKDPFGRPEPPEPPDAAALGLLSKKAVDVSLASAGKRKRPDTSSSNASQPMGWSGAFKRGLLDKEGKDDSDKHQPKKTRLLLDGKGIRTPGRDSLPSLKNGVLSDDDDGLDII